MEQKRKHSYTYFHCLTQQPQLWPNSRLLLGQKFCLILKFVRILIWLHPYSIKLLTGITRCCSSSVRVPVWSTTVELWRFWWRRFRSTASTARWNINATRSLQTFGPWKGETDWLCVCTGAVNLIGSLWLIKKFSLCFVSVGSWCVQMWWPEASISPMLTGCCSTILPAAPGNVSETDVTGSN